MNRDRSTSILVAAAWLGMTGGWLEGAVLLSLQAAGLSTWIMDLWGVAPPILWISPLVVTVLFLTLAFFWVAVAWLLPRRNVPQWALVFFLFLIFYDLLACTDRLRERGAIPLAIGLAVQAGILLGRKDQAFRLFQRRSLPVLLALCLLLWAGVTFGSLWLEGREVAGAPPPPDSPNVLLVVWDTGRADHTSLLGYARDTTPNVARRAASAIVFENAYAASAWTPSHATLFTGLYQHQLEEEGRLPGRFTTIAEVLRDRGYATASLVANTAWLTRSSGLMQGFIHHEDFFGNAEDSFSRTLFGRKLLKYLLTRSGRPAFSGRKDASTITRSFLGWLDRRPAGRPFFAFLNYYDLHEPVFPPDAFAARFANALAIRSRQPLQTHKPIPKPVSPARLQADMDAYDGAVAYLDSEFERLYEALEQRGLAQNTIVILTADHGHSFGEAGVYGHRTSVRVEQVHVPLVVWWPARIRSGQRVGWAVGHSRIPATLAQAAGFGSSSFPNTPPLFRITLGNAPEVLPGDSPLAELDRPSSRDMDETWPVSGGDLRSIFVAEWHFIRRSDGHEDLYNLKNDPNELQNLAGRPESQAVLSALRTQLEKAVPAAIDQGRRGRGTASGPDNVAH